MSFLEGIVGSFSTGAADNPTVAMMDAAFAEGGLPWRYVNCEVEPDQLDAAVAGARAMGWQGFNCSMPHKQTVIPLLDGLSPSAEICHAVNCVAATADGWSGHNTDGAGFVASVLEVMPLEGARVLVLGSGGAAHAIAVEAALVGAASILVASRNATTGERLAALVDDRTTASAEVLPWSDPIAAPSGVDLVVNATPVGSLGEGAASLPIDLSAVGHPFVAADVVFSPPDTGFLDAARAAGATTVDGTGMLVNQAAENIRLWTGVRPETAPMRTALEAALGLT
ncbi:MAG: shikimate dehydrogenase [Actinomycetota bacterium]